jgi:hypothetical protein
MRIAQHPITFPTIVMIVSMATLALWRPTCVLLEKMVMTTTQMFLHWDIAIGKEHNVMLLMSKVLSLLKVE